MPLARFGLTYFCYLLYLGSWSPYWTTWATQGLHFSDDVISLLAPLFVASAFVGNFFISRLADRLRWRRRLQRALTLVAIGTCIAWSFVSSPYAAAALIALHGTTGHVQTGLLDASIIDALGPRRNRYGILRAMGSVGFAISSLVVGRLRDGHPEVIPIAFVVGMTAFHVMTWFVPDTQPMHVEVEPERPRIGAAQILRIRPLVLLFVVAILHAAAFAPYEFFGPRYFAAAGLTPAQNGQLYPVGIVSEVLVFVGGTALVRRFRPAHLAAFAVLLAAVRWFVMARVDGVFAMTALQVTHGVCFGLFYSSAVHIVSGLVPQEARTTGQALFSMSLGLGYGTGGFLAGQAIRRIGPERTLDCASMVGIIAFVVLVIVERRSHRRGE